MRKCKKSVISSEWKVTRAQQGFRETTRIAALLSYFDVRELGRISENIEFVEDLLKITPNECIRDLDLTWVTFEFI